MSTTEKHETTEKHDRKTIAVHVVAPRSPKPKTFIWDKHLLVSAAAAEVAAAFGYDGGTPVLSKGDHALDPTQQLHQAGVRDGDTLHLSDKGGGV